MKYSCPEYYFDFVCEADNCTDTCCKHWQVEIDYKTYLNYKFHISEASDLGLKLKKDVCGIKVKRFANRSDGSCPFLSNSLLCDLYTAVGHDNLPRTCRLYPRYINNFGGYEERGLSFSCPAAAKLIAKGVFDIREHEDTAPITDFTDVDADRFLKIKKARDDILYVIADESISLTDCVESILLYAQRIEKSLSNKSASSVSFEVVCSNKKISDYGKILNKTIKEHLKHKHLDKKWETYLMDSIDKELKFNEDMFRIWLFYIVHRYFIKSVYDLKLVAKIKAAIISFVLVSALKFDIVTSMQKYSKETEHNEYNINRLFRFAEKAEI